MTKPTYDELLSLCEEMKRALNEILKSECGRNVLCSGCCSRGASIAEDALEKANEMLAKGGEG